MLDEAQTADAGRARSYSGTLYSVAYSKSIYSETNLDKQNGGPTHGADGPWVTSTCPNDRGVMTNIPECHYSSWGYSFAVRGSSITTSGQNTAPYEALRNPQSQSGNYYPALAYGYGGSSSSYEAEAHGRGWHLNEELAQVEEEEEEEEIP